ncbi:hypothetical protein COOONC_05014 [Cooperia oncophora]
MVVIFAILSSSQACQHRDTLLGSTLAVDSLNRIRSRIQSPHYGAAQGITLMPYVTSHEEIVTVISVQRPSASLFHQRFAISQEEALLPVRCPTANATNVSLSTTSNKGHQNRDRNRLPIYTPSVDLSYDNMQIYAHYTKCEVTLAIKSSLLINSAEFVIEQQCPVELSTVKGCYCCQEGAELTAYCTTALESTVTIQCENLAFTVECDPSNRTSKIALQFDKSLSRKNAL